MYFKCLFVFIFYYFKVLSIYLQCIKIHHIYLQCIKIHHIYLQCIKIHHIYLQCIKIITFIYSVLKSSHLYNNCTNKRLNFNHLTLYTTSTLYKMD